MYILIILPLIMNFETTPPITMQDFLTLRECNIAKDIVMKHQHCYEIKGDRRCDAIYKPECILK